MIRRDRLPQGHRLTEQALCDELGVSRSPVRKALQYLSDTGVVCSKPNKGYQVAMSWTELGSVALPEAPDSDEAVYLRIADDRGLEAIGGVVSEAELMQRYGSTRLQIQRVLNRMAREGLIERNTGRGWLFLPLLGSAEAYRESYRFRMIIEPAALVEPGYAVDRAELDKCYREQMELLSGGIESWTRPELFRSGVHLHETIVAGAHNRLLLDALRKVNQLRRLVEYRSKLDPSHMRDQCIQHLELIDLIKRDERLEASFFLREHLNGAKASKADL